MTRTEALDVLARHHAAGAVGRLLETPGWPVRAMSAADKGFIRMRVKALHAELAPSAEAAELAYDVLLGRTSAADVPPDPPEDDR